MPIFQSLLRSLFHLLYHPFAWTYDLVAAVVSLGRWKDWVYATLPYLEGRVLEIGYGPGHLQVAWQGGGGTIFGLDESPQMAQQARRRLLRAGSTCNLSRGLAQHLPFPAGAFESVVATFPSEYIFDPQTLREIRRVLRPGGKLLILLNAWITGKSLPERLAAGAFALTGQAGAIEAAISGMEGRLRASGFRVGHELVERRGSRVLVMLCQV
jgi:SAM-dependent methyltransferase